MIPPQHLGELVRQHHLELAAQAHHAHLAKAAKAAADHPSLAARGWNSLVWLAHFVAWRHNEPSSQLPGVATSPTGLAAPPPAR